MELIKFYENKDENYIINNKKRYLSDLRKINIFIGANNSGKSRFLRKMFVDEKTFDYTHDSKKIKEIIEDIVDNADEEYLKSGYFFNELRVIQTEDDNKVFQVEFNNLITGLNNTLASGGDSRSGSYASRRETAHFLKQEFINNKI